VTPDFDDLVGAELEPAERVRLERVHDLLVAAGPPPEPRAPTVVHLPSRRRRGALLAIAAALAVAAFALGAALGSNGRSVDFTETMRGTPVAASATASLKVFAIDDAGNWPMELEVDGLPPAAPNIRPFELWLVRKGELAALCGTFRTDEKGDAKVPMNAPYHFDDFDGWVVVEEGSETPLLTT
jgi:hypothetical protein